MRLKEPQIKKIADLILRNLKQKNLVTLRKKEFQVLEAIIKVINDDLHAESKLDADARKMMDQYRKQIDAGQVDEQKMFLMIKKQLAKERKIIL